MAIPPAPGPSAPGTTVVEIKVYGAQLDQEKINRLIRASTEGVTPPTAELTTVWNGARLRADSLSGLRTAVENRLEPGDWRRLDNLRISTGDETRSVVVEIGAQAATVTIESTDGDWAIGRGEQFRKILQYAGGSRVLRRWCAARLSAAGAMAAAMIVALLAVAGVVDGRPGSVATAALILAVATISGFLIGRLRARRNRIVLWIDGPIPKPGWTTWAVGERIAALALVVALGSLVVNILK
ncbi:hypothetical protein [Actinoplanes sp. NPDC049681]|uniref:hypothetical protein n=1 Tax=Actinoplanes sp. NPDC049681 TaxID=3363905 RepID=UPI0037B3B74B